MLIFSMATDARAANSYERVYINAWKSLANNYYDRDKLSQWKEWEHRFDGKLHSHDDAQRAVHRMVRSLEDDYTFVLSDDQNDSREKEHKTPAVSEVSIIGNNVGYIKLDSFSGRNVVGAVKKALRAVAHTDGVILDLRGNHGGYMEAAREVFGMLADEGPFVSYRGFSDGGPDEQAYILKRDRWYIKRNAKLVAMHRQRNMIGGSPLAVLVNQDTRSAAEMLSGALRDNCRAIVLGKQTYGKGVLQDSFSLGEHLTMKVVTAKYFLPSGVNIHQIGIQPDITVDGTYDEQLSRATQLFSSAIAHSAPGRQDVAVANQSDTSL